MQTRAQASGEKWRGIVGWHCQVALSGGSVGWQCWVALLGGIVGWQCWVALLGGIVGWHSRVAVVGGSGGWHWCCVALLLGGSAGCAHLSAHGKQKAQSIPKIHTKWSRCERKYLQKGVREGGR